MNTVLNKLPRHFSILISDIDLREMDWHETSKRTAFTEQMRLVRGTLVFFKDKGPVCNS